MQGSNDRTHEDVAWLRFPDPVTSPTGSEDRHQRLAPRHPQPRTPPPPSLPAVLPGVLLHLLDLADSHCQQSSQLSINTRHGTDMWDPEVSRGLSVDLGAMDHKKVSSG